MILQVVEQISRFTIDHEVSCLCGFLFAIALYYLVIYPFCISPLKDIPGPYLHRVSYIPSLNAQRKFQWVEKVHNLHKLYGDVVVLSPSAVGCNGRAKYLNDIYVKNMPKAKFYENFRNHGFKDNMFSSLENDRHIKYKRMVQNLYSKSAVFNPKNTTRENINEKIKQLVNQVYISSTTGQKPDFINARSKRNEYGKGHVLGSASWYHPKTNESVGIDVYSLFGSLAMDVVSAFELGVKNGSHLLLSPEKRDILVSFRMQASMVFWTTLMPKFWNWAAGPEIRAASAEIEEWQLNLYKGAEENVPEKDEGRNLTTMEAFRKNGLVGVYAYSFLTDNIFAGHETTAIQLTYLCYELSRPIHKSTQERLRSEIREAFGTPQSIDECITDFERVDKLEFLEALMQENSRVHSSIPGGEPRVTNVPYTVDVENKTVSLPVGTEISCQPYSMHRVESVFPRPDEWIPERWLQSEQESSDEYAQRLKDMQRYMMPFGKGVRMCLGMNLAMIEMKLAMANLYWRFESGLCTDWCQITPTDKASTIKIGQKYADSWYDESMMTKVDAYTTRPHYDECWLVWSTCK